LAFKEEELGWFLNWEGVSHNPEIFPRKLIWEAFPKKECLKRGNLNLNPKPWEVNFSANNEGFGICF